MKVLTERQYRRREKILATARDLISKHGYVGVTMRELAEKSSVTPKTLYHQFGSKEKLLRIAVEERFRHTYQAISDHEVKKGIDKLFFIIDAVAESIRKNASYAKALAPMLRSRKSDPFSSIRMETYRAAIEQIESEDDFVDWVDVDIISQVVYRHVNPLYVGGHIDVGSGEVKLEVLIKHDLSLMLSSISKGYTQQKVIKTVRALQKTLAKK
jgi:AcrR family transcriptional regulator|tara:strand:+ start:3393 stop:4031 length:639 start_codon:yes stop_codon:yes gene_type:complete